MSENQAVPDGGAVPVERVTIEVPVTLAAMLRGLTTRASELLGEDPGDCRRAVELTVLTRGCQSVSDELKQLAEQSERMGWPR